MQRNIAQKQGSKRPQPDTDKYSRALDQEKKGSLSWSDAGPEDLLAAVAAVTEDGAALLLSKTSDGGALVIQVWNGQGRSKLYPASMAELTSALMLLVEIAQLPK